MKLTSRRRSQQHTEQSSSACVRSPCRLGNAARCPAASTARPCFPNGLNTLKCQVFFTKNGSQKPDVPEIEIPF